MKKRESKNSSAKREMKEKKKEERVRMKYLKGAACRDVITNTTSTS